MNFSNSFVFEAYCINIGLPVGISRFEISSSLIFSISLIIVLILFPCADIKILLFDSNLGISILFKKGIIRIDVSFSDSVLGIKDLLGYFLSSINES